MIMESLDWAHKNGTYGMLVWVAGATFACCTGLAFVAIIYDVIKDSK